MKSNSYKGDWIKLVEGDFQRNGIVIDEKEIQEMNLIKYKALIKKSV